MVAGSHSLTVRVVVVVSQVDALPLRCAREWEGAGGGGGRFEELSADFHFNNYLSGGVAWGKGRSVVIYVIYGPYKGYRGLITSREARLDGPGCC